MTVHYLADGDAGAADSIGDMRAIVDRALKDPQVYILARQIVQPVPAYNDRAELQALFNWVQQNIRFVKGVMGKQSLQTVEATLAMRAGQCTDLASLLAALAMSIGYPARFVAVATDPTAPDQFSHIYTEVQIEGEWIPVDAAREDAAFGVAPQRVYRSESFPILDAVGNMPRLAGAPRLGMGDDSTADDVANAIAAGAAGAAEVLTAANQQPAYVLVNGQYQPNPNATQPVLQNTSQALGVPSLILLGLGAWFVYTILKR